MKIQVRNIIFLILLFNLSVFFTPLAFGQCSGSPNPACINTMGPCGVLNNGVVGQYYNDTISFWAPRRVDASVQSGGLFDSLDFIEMKILNVTGLPTGITWNCNVGNCTYNPQPNGTLASINFCGTPISQGNYTVTITIKGTVSTPIGNQSQNQIYNLPLSITLGSGSNAGFSFNPSQACDSAWVAFSPLLNFPLPQITQWDWDFGNGNTFSGQNPPPQFYPAPGNYPVTCTTTVFNMRLNSLTINACGQSWWCGDIEELNCSNGNADLRPTFTTGSSSWNGPEISDNCLPTWNNINFILTGTSYSLNVTEVDAISANDIAAPYAGTVTGPGTYNINHPTWYTASFTIGLVQANQIIVTDTIRIYQTPVTDTIEATLQAICAYETTTLSVYPGMLYEWYLNDTLTVQTGNLNTYTTGQAGSYKVKIIDPVSGCNVTTAPISISALPMPPPGFPNVGISVNGNGTITTALSGNYTYQWIYFDGINYSIIPAPEGTQSSYTPTFNGTYCLIATNAAGCYDTSNCVQFYLSLENPFEANQVVVYPNPSQGQVNMHMQLLENDLQVRVFNMLGEQVYEIHIANPMGSITHSFDFSALRKGIYLMELAANGYRHVEKLILN